MNKNIFSLYESDKGKLVPYKGGCNFEYKPIVCKNCGGTSIRIPIHAQYLKMTSWCVVIDIKNGTMIVDDSPPDFMYMCNNCSYAETPDLKK